ncbi:MAG: IclR family transcriptional regulator [Chloroflexota bacterium]|nr:IclR family transcriptional regulator [Chloroflexota bacterium]
MSRVQSIERAFTVLEALADGPLGVTEVADRVSLPKSTVARLLGSLAREGAVEQVPGRTDYRVGGRIVTLAAGVRPTRSLVALARPHLVQLAATVGEAAGLAIPDGFLVHYVDQVDSPHPVGIRDWTGTRLPMHAVSSGLIFLAHMHPADIDAFLASSLERYTPTTVVDPAIIRERLRRTQLDGYAWARDEVADGISSVAAALADEDGEVVAAIHVHGPSYRFPAIGAEEQLSEQVVTCAARISASLRQAG